MSQLVLNTPEAELRRMSPERRLAQIQELVGISIEAVAKAAQVLLIMEEEGDPLDEIPTTILRMLRSVNAKQILPGIVVNLTGRLRQYAAKLPITDQERVLRDRPYLVADPDEVEPLQLKPSEMTQDQVRRVFANGRVNPPEIQKKLFPNREPASKREARAGLDWEIIDSEHVSINGTKISKKQLLKIIGEM